MNNYIIKTENLSVKYDSNIILENIDFLAKDGEFIVIVGKSGEGKTTFLNAIANLIPFKGRIFKPQNIGFVFQKHAIFPWMTVVENIKYGLDDYSSEEKELIVEKTLKRIEMVNFANRYPTQLSGGQIQRVALARVLATTPDILLMDEPYASLDYHTREKMQQWLLSIWEDSKKTVLFVTHYIDEAIFLADKIIILKDKRFYKSFEVPFSRPREESVRFTKTFYDLRYSILSEMSESDNILNEKE